MTTMSDLVDFAHVMQSLQAMDDREYDPSMEFNITSMTPYQHPEPFSSYTAALDNNYNYYGSNNLNNAMHADNRVYVEFQDFPTHIPGFYEAEESVELPIQPDTDSCTITHYTVPGHEISQKLPNFTDIFSKCMSQQKKPTTRRGRPPTYPKPGYPYCDSDGIESDEDRLSPNGVSNASTRCRKGAKNILLWKFLLEELRKPGATHVQWVTERDGVFKFVDTQECSRLWGMKKRKEDMNFEKLSRGIRHYYKDGLMSRVDGTRLVYQFHWSRVPRAFRCYGK